MGKEEKGGNKSGNGTNKKTDKRIFCDKETKIKNSVDKKERSMIIERSRWNREKGQRKKAKEKWEKR